MQGPMNIKSYKPLLD